MQLNSGGMHFKLALVEAKEYCALDANDAPDGPNSSINIESKYALAHDFP